MAAGDRLPAGADPGGPVGLGLEPRPRFSGGRIRIVPSAQTGLFTAAERTRFAATDFVRDARGNRQGVRLAHEGAPFSAEGGLSILSEVVVPGDIQMTGDGIPYVLLPECQTMGGYPRIGTVVPDDLAQVAQAPAGARLRFDFVDPAEALAELRRTAAGRAADLRRRIRPLVRDPATIPDLLSYQLVSGVTAGHDAAEQEISGGTAK